ncbi:pikachurin-like [Aplochiton taeniatus]
MALSPDLQQLSGAGPPNGDEWDGSALAARGGTVSEPRAGFVALPIQRQSDVLNQPLVFLRLGRLGPPLDIELEAINCTSVRVRWRIPWRHVGTVTGYKVFYTEMRDGRPAGSAVARNVPLSLDMLSNALEVGGLKAAAQYVFSVGAYGWAGEGRPSVPRRVTTLAPELCVPPVAPSQPVAVALSDTQARLSWEQNNSSPALHFLVFYVRPEVDGEWTSAGDPFEGTSVVLKGLHPTTQYQFIVQAVNSVGASPLSAISDPIWTHTLPVPVDTSSPYPLARPSTPAQGRGQVRGLHDLSCEDTACPANSVCIDDYQKGGSRCYCALGQGGDACSEGVVAQYPRFHGHSYMALEPLKNSYRYFHIMLEFKADSENGLLLFCGENEHGSGDYASLALLHGRLYFRFNCGTGSAQIVSDSRVALGQWNSVVISREGAIGWLRLNNDTPVTGQSQGDFTKISFRTPLYLGGSPNAYWLAKTAGTNRGFQGCVKSLTINHRGIDMKPWPIGWALSGADVGECSMAVCSVVTCANGGTCLASSALDLCLCPLGYRGRLCQESFGLVVPLFSAALQSYASAPWPRPSHHYLSFMEFDLVFQSAAPDGTLLYSQDSDSRDFLSVILVGGFLELRFDCGSGIAVIRSEEQVTMNEWHDLWVSRTGRQGVLQVDTQRPTHGTSEGAFTQIRCSSSLYLGGVPDFSRTKPQAALFQPLTGSIQKMVVNGVTIRLPGDLSAGANLDNALHPCVGQPCADGGTCQPLGSLYRCDCPLWHSGTLCQNVTEPVAIPQFIGRSYLTYDSKDILKRLSGPDTRLRLRFRSSVQDGLLLWRGHTHLGGNSDFVSLGLKDGALIFSYNLGSGIGVVTINGSFNDGEWHWVQVVREGQSARLTVDHARTSTGRSPGNMRQLNTNTMLYLGGMKEISRQTHGQYIWGLVGCISHLTLSSTYHLSLLEDAVHGKNINTCSP